MIIESAISGARHTTNALAVFVFRPASCYLNWRLL